MFEHGPLTAAWDALRADVHELHHAVERHGSACEVLIEHDGELLRDKSPSPTLLATVTLALPHYAHETLRFGLLATTHPAILEAVQGVNTAKAHVKCAVKELRRHRPRRVQTAAPSSSSDTESRLLAETEWNEKSVRSDAMAKVLASAGMSSFHLNKVYQPIRVLPATVERCYWSWQAHQHRIRKITTAAVREQINYRVEQGTLDLHVAEQWREQLKAHEGRPLRRIQWLAPALRLQYSVRGEPGMPLRRNKIAGTGVCILQQTTLPPVVKYTPWREIDEPNTAADSPTARQAAWEQSARLGRRRYQPVIEALDLYTL